jgi:hypothetical protein
MKPSVPSPKTLTLKVAIFVFAETLEENRQHSTLRLQSAVTGGMKEARWNAVLLYVPSDWPG